MQRHFKRLWFLLIPCVLWAFLIPVARSNREKQKVQQRQRASQQLLTLMENVSYRVCDARSLQLVQLYLERGATPNAKLRDGKSLLITACESMNSQLARLLACAGAPINQRNAEGETPLMIGARWYDEGSLARVLIPRKADLNARDKIGRTALHNAMGSCGACACWSNGETVRLLLKAGARADVADKQGFTPLMLASQYESSGQHVFTGEVDEIVALLLRHGAKASRRNVRGATALSLMQSQRFSNGDAARLRAIQQLQGAMKNEKPS